MQVSANGARAAQQARQAQLCHDDIPSRPIVHSGRLVYAKPQDLPSYPSIGLSAKGSAASAAASLGWANQKSPEPKSPDPRRSVLSIYASTAVTMADDTKPVPAPARESADSNYGAKAALLAAAQSAKPHSSQPRSPTMGDGLSAANLAFRSNRASMRSTNSGTSEHQRSLVAAKGAVARRRRAGSAPTPRESYPDEANAAANALSAATRAHRPSLSPAPFEEMGSVPYTTMNRMMFTSHPPVKPEVDEQKRADVLHASAVAMAKKMYTQQQRMIEAKKTHAETSSRGDMEVSSSISDDPQPAQLTTLQDAAYKQAQIRLAKMQQNIEQNRERQEYYGTKPLSHRFSVKAKLRKRSLSDGVVIEDQRRSQDIKKQMSLFSTRLSEVDEQKRQQDQDRLLAAAQRNVHERLKGMDLKIANETGMVPPSTLTQWEVKARAIAHSRAFQQSNPHQGKVDLGAGIHMDQEEINAIAARRIQPILDEINAKAELEHARQTELRLEMEREKEEQEVERARQKEVQDIHKKLKQQEKIGQKGRKAEEKQMAKTRKEEEKAAKAEQKRMARAGKTKPAEHSQRFEEDQEMPQSIITMNSNGQPVRIPRSNTHDARTGENFEESEDGLMSPTSPGGIKTWFKSRFSRGPKSPTEEQNKGKGAQKRFVGGISLTGHRHNKSVTSLSNRNDSAREVGMASGSLGSHHSRLGNDSDVHYTSTESEDELYRREFGVRDGAGFTPPRSFRDSSPAQGQSPARDSRFREIM